MSVNTFEETGQAWVRAALNQESLDLIADWAGRTDRPGQRITASIPDAAAKVLTTLVDRFLSGAVLTRAVAFNKSGATNWSLPWHQDRVIAVAERCDVDGFHNWTLKDGIWHCEPPIEILQQMVFARLHLDAAQQDNGCMEIAPGSHRLGLISAKDAPEVAAKLGTELSLASAGDLQILKMLTLHRSRPARQPTPRRAVRLDFVKMPLRAGFEPAFFKPCGGAN
ncbi:MAG: phytanoyl-CoA dioxygenase family protein [Pseudomonadota bacterium]